MKRLSITKRALRTFRAMSNEQLIKKVTGRELVTLRDPKWKSLGMSEDTIWLLQNLAQDIVNDYEVGGDEAARNSPSTELYQNNYDLAVGDTRSKISKFKNVGKKRRSVNYVQSLVSGYIDTLLDMGHVWYEDEKRNDENIDYFETPRLSDAGFTEKSIEPRSLAKITKDLQNFAKCVGDEVLSKYDPFTLGADFYVEQQGFDDGFYDRVYQGDEEYLTECFETLGLPEKELEVFINSKDLIVVR